jgi:hypothetical protein
MNNHEGRKVFFVSLFLYGKLCVRGERLCLQLIMCFGQSARRGHKGYCSIELQNDERLPAGQAGIATQQAMQ